MLKRIFDLVLALILAILLLPLMAATAAAVAWNMGFPVLFGQVRPGLRGRPFKVLKFRTMAEAAGADGRPLPDERRLTMLGALLRRFSLDELPQLFNVIRGDMSLVGPRPLLMEYLPLYNAEQMRRHDVRPGITGWAQVNGRNALPWEERFRMDVWYVDNRSMLLDLHILALTALRVLRSRGINEPGQATMTPFRGNSDKSVKPDLDRESIGRQH
jgi:lipopolysaccharide/colanic/teichoic acid biosynthesis glycosyltransferase